MRSGDSQLLVLPGNLAEGLSVDGSLALMLACAIVSVMILARDRQYCTSLARGCSADAGLIGSSYDVRISGSALCASHGRPLA